MLDRYWFGDVSRISPEAPVPVVLINEKDEDQRLGGAANVAWNCKELGAKTRLLSVVGRDEPGQALEKLLRSEAHRCEPAPRPRSQHDAEAARHQPAAAAPAHRLREARPRARCSPEARRVQEGAARVRRRDPLSDYGKGGLAHIAEMIRSAARRKRVLVDPKGDDYSRYKGASIITPNLAELREVVGTWKDEKDLKSRAQALRQKLGLEALLLTRGEDGMTLFAKKISSTIKAEACAKCST